MKVLLATGIYPPGIGGPATYVQALASELTKKDIDVVVVTYGRKEGQKGQRGWRVIRVSKWGGSVLRWWRYAKALRREGTDADIVYAFSSVSCGVPLWIAGLRKPRHILRLGGDFIWERYTDCGGTASLQEWYRSLHWSLRFSHRFMGWLLRRFDHIVFSTEFQKKIYEDFFQPPPPYSVIENALPSSETASCFHTKHRPFRLLFAGRFVGFKNLQCLLDALFQIPHVTLTLAGSGPMRRQLAQKIEKLGLTDRVRFMDSVDGKAKEKLFMDHDLLILPSITELSPNVALEARVAGLPVLLTSQTGLSETLTAGMIVRPLKTVEDIVREVLAVEQEYDRFAAEAATIPHRRGWDVVCQEHVRLFQELLKSS